MLDEYGWICLMCITIRYYDGWDRLKEPLTYQEAKALIKKDLKNV